jgi:hypothetical protein
MAAPDPPGFNATAVRNAFRIPMKMEAVGEGPLFIMSEEVIDGASDFYGVSLDADELENSARYRTKVPAVCAYDSLLSGDVQIPSKGVDGKPVRLVVTILEEDYEPIKDHIGVEIGGIYFAREYNDPPIGLFSVTVHQIYYKSMDS